MSSSSRAAIRRWSALLGAALVFCLAIAASGHQSTPGVLAFKEIAQSQYLARWSPPVPGVPGLRARLPDACRANGSATLDLPDQQRRLASVSCGDQELSGKLTFEGMGPSHGPYAVNVERLNGVHSFQLSGGAPPSVLLERSQATELDLLRRYILLGIEHIGFGADHLLFLLGLLLLVRGWRSLVATVTAFTLAHSVTLVAASLEVVEVASAPVEICIALSVLLLAFEAAGERPTATRRWPWLVALGFGLLHGLGFASALADVGLPERARLLALVSFNIGVELGQLAVVAIAGLSHRLLRSYPVGRRVLERVALGTLTVCSVYWLLTRVQAWITELGV